MCGFSGYIGKVDDCYNLLQKLGDAIAHRGPNASEVWFSEDKNIGIVHKRLSIVDLSEQANQPMNFNQDYILVFNGEIYNHKLIRSKLESKGVKFRTTHSDTEVLYNALINLGLSATIELLEGMFSFAFFDLKRGRAFLVRDRFGEKPLYYMEDSGRIYFSSEVKSFIESGIYRPKLNETAFIDYLSFRTAPTSDSFYEGVKKLPPASILELDLKTLNSKIYEYWSLLHSPLVNCDYNDLIEQTDSILTNKIAQMTDIDVPFGLYLSGGVDSTLLLSYLSENNSPITCFNVSYEGDKDSNETQRARSACAKFGGKFIEVKIDINDYLNAFDKVIYSLDEPSAAPITVSQYYLSKAARENNTPVIFSGEGGDELFLGYPLWSKIAKLERVLSKYPIWAKKLCHQTIKNIQPKRNRRIEYFRRAKSSEPIFWGGVEDFMGMQKNTLLNKKYSDILHSTYARVIKPHRDIFEASRYRDDEFKWMSYLDSKIRLPELMLQRSDRMTMANSIEGRAPLLDHKLAELAFGADSKLLRDKNENKAVLKSIASNIYGNDFVYMKKKGFTAPISSWHGEKLGNCFKEKLFDFNSTNNLFNHDMLKNIIDNDGRNNTLYFSLANFAYWHEKVIG